MDGDDSIANQVTRSPHDALSNGFSGILAPGSSLDPAFLLVLDGILATLLVVLLGLFVVTNYNPHLLFLSIIELCLWVSIKWFLSELRQVRPQEGAQKRDSAKIGSKPKEE